MDQGENKEIGLLFNKQAEALVVLLHHRIDLDHDTICSLSVNKELEKILKNTAIQRKKYIESNIYKDTKIPFVFTPPPSIIWHKYGSSCGRVIIAIDTENITKLTENFSKKINYPLEIHLQRFCLDKPIKMKLGTCKEFGKTLTVFNVPFFNQDDEFCFYGLTEKGEYQKTLWGAPQHIKEYSLKKDGTVLEYYCALCIDISLLKDYALSYFQAFPILLKALLNSKMHSITYDQVAKIYHLEDAIIPDNYKECISDENYTSFDDLPKELAEAIEKRYKDQQK